MQQRRDADWMSADDTESLRTIHAHQPDLSPEESFESESVRFDFSDVLQRSRVYRRNQAFCGSFISTLTNSVYSLGWSFFSDLSMAEVSDISVINLAITEEETFNPRRSSQTWSAQPNERVFAGADTDIQEDGKRTQGRVFPRNPAPTIESAVTRGGWSAIAQAQQLPEALTELSMRPIESGDIIPRLEEHYGKRSSVELTGDPAPTSTPAPPMEPLDLPSHSEGRPTTPSQPHEPVMEDEADYPCKRCGEVCFMQLYCLSAKPVTKSNF